MEVENVLFLWQNQSGAHCWSIVWRRSVSRRVHYGRFHCIVTVILSMQSTEGIAPFLQFICIYQPYCLVLIWKFYYPNVCFAAFQSGGVDLSQPIVFTCGGAMVAPLVAFALSLTGLSAPVYDVSYNMYSYYCISGHAVMQNPYPRLYCIVGDFTRRDFLPILPPHLLAKILFLSLAVFRAYCDLFSLSKRKYSCSTNVDGFNLAKIFSWTKFFKFWSICGELVCARPPPL